MLIKNNQLFIFLFCALTFISCANKTEEPNTEFGIKQLNSESPDSDEYVLVETNRGNFKLKLFKETPLHRSNFVNLVKNGYYDSQLFFRVKERFMIQAGDPKSKNASADKLLGETDVSYKIPAEIDPSKRYHKFGALSAASLNPAIESSGSHFYIITGEKATDKLLDNQEAKYNKTLRRKMFQSLQKPYQEKIDRLNEEGKTNAKKKRELLDMISYFSAKADSAMQGKTFSYTPQQRKEYKEGSGAFHLDGYFTVFGEVIEGMEIVEEISKSTRNVRERPVEDVVIKKMTIIEK